MTCAYRSSSADPFIAVVCKNDALPMSEFCAEHQDDDGDGKVRPPVWQAISLLTLTASRSSGPVLAVMVSPADFVVIAFEVLAPPSRGASELEAAAAVFGSHSHKVVGQSLSLSAGVALAESYAAAWLESDAACAALCACGEIAV